MSSNRGRKHLPGTSSHTNISKSSSAKKTNCRGFSTQSGTNLTKSLSLPDLWFSRIIEEGRLKLGETSNQLKSKKSQEDINYLFEDYLCALYTKAAVKEKFENEKKCVEAKLLCLGNKIAENKRIKFKSEKMIEELNYCDQIQSAVKAVEFLHESTGYQKCENDLKVTVINDDLHSELGKLKLSYIELLKDELTDDTLDYITKCIEVITGNPVDYKNQMKIKQLVDDEKYHSANCERKLQLLESIKWYSESLKSSNMENNQQLYKEYTIKLNFLNY